MIYSEENRHDRVEHNYQMWLIPNRTGTSLTITSSSSHQKNGRGDCAYRFRPMVARAQWINTDALIYAGLLAKGDHVTYQLGSVAVFRFRW